MTFQIVHSVQNLDRVQTPEISSIQERTDDTFVYTPGKRGSAQPSPHETIPINLSNLFSPFKLTNGPPESLYNYNFKYL